jgi:hypothetical protein
VGAAIGAATALLDGAGVRRIHPQETTPPLENKSRIT